MNDFFLSEEDFTGTLEDLRDAVDSLPSGDAIFTLGYFLVELADTISDGDKLTRDVVLDLLQDEIARATNHFDNQQVEIHINEDGELENDPDDTWVSDLEDARGVLEDYSDEDKLKLLSLLSAEIISEYEEGDDRDSMIEFFGDSVEEDIDFLDEFAVEEDEEGPSIGEVVDFITDYYSFHPNILRQIVNGEFGMDLMLYDDDSNAITE